MRALMRAGVNCTVSTDDPLSFANTLTEEYTALASEGGFTRAELAQVARNGWAVADVGGTERRRAPGRNRPDGGRVSQVQTHTVPGGPPRPRGQGARGGVPRAQPRGVPEVV
jgi:hypothetical protein